MLGGHEETRQTHEHWVQQKVLFERKSKPQVAGLVRFVPTQDNSSEKEALAQNTQNVPDQW